MIDHDASAIPRHYTGHEVTPIDLIATYELNFALGSVIKCVARHREKLGREDLLKALWWLLYELGTPKSTINWIVSAVKAEQWIVLKARQRHKSRKSA